MRVGTSGKSSDSHSYGFKRKLPGKLAKAVRLLTCRPTRQVPARISTGIPSILIVPPSM